MAKIPTDQHITYQLQYRKCGKASCSTCRTSQGHGPYWYAYWRVGSRLCSGYVGKIHPNTKKQAAAVAIAAAEAAKKAASRQKMEEYATKQAATAVI